MNNEELLFSYKKLNESFTRKLVYHFGGEKKAGFFSEFNTLLLSVLFALKFKYQFILYSADSHLAFGNGWNEFFEDFCPKFTNHFIGKSIGRTYLNTGNRRLFIYKLLTNNLIENDIYGLCRSAWFEKEHFYIPELGINGDIRHALKTITPIIYRFNKIYEAKINQLETSIEIPKNFVGFQIRGGDKANERELIIPQKYIEIAEERTTIRTGFIFTDDYRIYEKIKNDNPNWTLYTTVTKDETGYVHQDYLNADPETRHTGLIRMFTSVKILLKSSLFIGTYSTNPSLFISMQRDDNNCIGMDYERWLIL